jgi:hypothetical protein
MTLFDLQLLIAPFGILKLFLSDSSEAWSYAGQWE